VVYLKEDNRAIQELKMLILDMSSNNRIPFVGSNLSMAPTIYTLFTRHLNYIPSNPGWINRTRVVLSSKSHSAAYYAMLNMVGYQVSSEDLTKYGTLAGRLSVLPEKNLIPGVDISTGMPGLGISNAVGIALGERYLANLFVKSDPELKIIDYHTYCFCNYEDIMDGGAMEAFQYAASMSLNKLIFIYEDTPVMKDGFLKNIGNQNIRSKCASYGLNVIEVKDGNSVRAIDRAILAAKRSRGPSIIIISNKLGEGLTTVNTSDANNIFISQDEISIIKQKGVHLLKPYEISKDSMIYLNENYKKRLEKFIIKWHSIFERINLIGNESSKQLVTCFLNKNLDIQFNSLNYNIANGYTESLMETNQKIINLFAPNSYLCLNIITDIEKNYKITIQNSNELKEDPAGKNINIGPRNLIAAGLSNGLASLGFQVIVSSSLNQADSYYKGIKQATLMNLPVTYIFQKDSMFEQLEGPLYQPIEQINMLRLIPNLITFRPADIMEIMGSWDYILKTRKTSSIILSNQVVTKIPDSLANNTFAGAYITKKESTKLDGVILATGSDTFIATKIAYELESNGIDLRVVSIPSFEILKTQNSEYIDNLIPKNTKIVALESGSSCLWYQFINNKNNIIAIDEYGYNARSQELRMKMGFDYDNLKIKISRLFR